MEGVNLDEVNSLGFKDVEFVGFYDYFKATTKNKVRFESSYVYEKDLNREEYKTEKLIEIRKFDVPNQNQEKAIDINEEGKIVYNGNAEKSASCNGTFIVYRDIENAPDFELYIKDKDVVKMNIDDNKYQKVLFSDSRSKFTSRYEIYSTEPEKAEEYLSSKLLSRFVKLEKYFKKGITFFFKDGDLFVFLNKYRMNLVKIQEDRTLAHSDERFSCIHGYSGGFDHYRVYEVKYVGKCSKCGYDYEYDAGEEHIIFKCDNGAI